LSSGSYWGDLLWIPWIIEWIDEFGRVGDDLRSCGDASGWILVVDEVQFVVATSSAGLDIH